MAQMEDQALVLAYRIWVDEQRTTYVRIWDDGKVEFATREHASHTWGPPRLLHEEK